MKNAEETILKTVLLANLKGSPTGLMQRMMCKLLLTRSIKKLNMVSGVSTTPSFRACSDKADRTWGKNEKMLLKRFQKSIRIHSVKLFLHREERRIIIIHRTPLLLLSSMLVHNSNPSKKIRTVSLRNKLSRKLESLYYPNIKPSFQNVSKRYTFFSIYA